MDHIFSIVIIGAKNILGRCMKAAMSLHLSWPQNLEVLALTTFSLCFFAGRLAANLAR